MLCLLFSPHPWIVHNGNTTSDFAFTPTRRSVILSALLCKHFNVTSHRTESMLCLLFSLHPFGLWIVHNGNTASDFAFTPTRRPMILQAIRIKLSLSYAPFSLLFRLGFGSCTMIIRLRASLSHRRAPQSCVIQDSGSFQPPGTEM